MVKSNNEIIYDGSETKKEDKRKTKENSKKNRLKAGALKISKKKKIVQIF